MGTTSFFQFAMLGVAVILLGLHAILISLDHTEAVKRIKELERQNKFQWERIQAMETIPAV